MTTRTTPNIHTQLGSAAPNNIRILREVSHGSGVSYLVHGGADFPGSTTWVDIAASDTAEQATDKIKAKIR